MLRFYRGLSHKFARSGRVLGGIGLAWVLVVAAACGNRSSDDDISALLREGSESPTETEEPSGSASNDGYDPAESSVPEPASGGAGDSATEDTGPGVAGAKPRATGSSGAQSGSGGAQRSAASADASKPSPRRGGSSGSPPAAGQESGGAAPAPPPAPNPEGAGGNAPAPAAPAQCTGDEPPIVIGSVGTLSGFVGYLFAPGFKAVSAWAAAINEQGGLNCHKVKHHIGDSGGDPARFQALVRKFVEQEGAIAFVFNADSFAAQAAADYLEGKNIPVIGGGGGEMFMYNNNLKMQFPVFSMGVPMQMNQVFQSSRQWLDEGKKKVGTVSCVEAEYCPIFDDTIAKVAPELGFEVVYQANVSLTSPDYTSNCLEARNAGVQAFITSLDGQTNHRLANSCGNMGFDAPIAVAAIQGTDDFKDNPNLNQSITAMNSRPWVHTSHPEIAQFLTTFKKYVPDAVVGAGAINGWTTARAFEEAMSGVAPKSRVTSEAVLQGLYSLNGNDLGGLTYPLSFGADQPKKEIVCGWPVLAVDGKFTAPSDMACMPGYEP